MTETTTDRSLILRVSTPGVSHGSRVALGPLELSFTTGVTALVGANGAGKSTLLNLIARPRPADTVELLESTTKLGLPHALARLPQNFGHPRSMRLEDFVAHAAWLKCCDEPGAVDRALAAVGLTDRRRDRLSTLSGGMLRRAGIAACLVSGRAVLLLDEPTAGLDPLQRRSLWQVITDCTRDCIVIVSTHEMDDVNAIADTVVVLGSGAVRRSGPREDFGDPSTLADTITDLLA